MTETGDREKILFPQTFIQIHYHNRIGGVTKVMEHYAEAFNRCRHSGEAQNIIICSLIERKNCFKSGVRLIHAPDCDYHSYRSGVVFEKCRRRLVSLLVNIIENHELKLPVCVVGHNMTLGKNCALTSAFAELCKKYRSPSSMVQFVSVIHDLAEEGRMRMLDEIERVAGFRKKFKSEIYPETGNVRFVVLNHRTAQVLNTAGVISRQVPNPVFPPPIDTSLSPKDKEYIQNALVRLAAEDATRFDPSKRIVFYPVRILGRKNVVESILYGCVMLKANLVIGGTGKTRADIKLFDTIKEFCRRNALTVVFDVNRISSLLPSYMKSLPVFPLLISLCDVCITTSVAEGFGYAFFEPWLYNKVVTGRKAKGFSSPEAFDTSLFYSRLPVPAEWISAAKLKKKYFSALKRHYRLSEYASFKKFSAHFDKKMLQTNTLDFAECDIENQLAVLDRLLKDPYSLERLKNSLDNHLQKLHSSLYCSMIVAANKKAVEDALSYPAFIQSFKKIILNRRAGRRLLDRRIPAIKEFFGDLQEFRLLLTPDARVFES
ncbi:MAG: hypothetical protein GF401_03485 [Chitinivibrionales bacterium]|nr:hypothetical protein [Chitinivibrionales bacterium]